MRRKLIICLIIFVSILIGIGCCVLLFCKDKDMGKDGTLNINGMDITKDHVILHNNRKNNYADLPFIEILKSLGYNVVWSDDSNAVITCNEKTYILNLAEVSLKLKDGDNQNIIEPPNGVRHYRYTVLEKELILDSGTIIDAMYFMKDPIRVTIDHDKSIVYVTERED